MKLPKHLSFSLQHNQHKLSNQSAEEYLRFRCDGDFQYYKYEGIFEDMIAKDSIWHMRFYPDTPTSPYSIWGSTLEEVLEVAHKQFECE